MLDFFSAANISVPSGSTLCSSLIYLRFPDIVLDNNHGVYCPPTRSSPVVSSPVVRRIGEKQMVRGGKLAFAVASCFRLPLPLVLLRSLLSRTCNCLTDCCYSSVNIINHISMVMVMSMLPFMPSIDESGPFLGHSSTCHVLPRGLSAQWGLVSSAQPRRYPCKFVAREEFCSRLSCMPGQPYDIDVSGWYSSARQLADGTHLVTRN